VQISAVPSHYLSTWAYVELTPLFRTATRSFDSDSATGGEDDSTYVSASTSDPDVFMAMETSFIKSQIASKAIQGASGTKHPHHVRNKQSA
jgi:hypothetical protein